MTHLELKNTKSISRRTVLGGAAAATTLSMTGLPLTASAQAHNPPLRGNFTRPAYQKLDQPTDIGSLPLLTEAGHEVSLDSFRGKVLLMSFFHSACGECAVEMPELDQLQAQMGGRKFQIIAVDLEYLSWETLTKAQRFYQRHNMRHVPMYRDAFGLAFQSYAPPSLATGGRGTPSVALFDHYGRIVGGVSGRFPSFASSEGRQLLQYYIDRA